MDEHHLAIVDALGQIEGQHLSRHDEERLIAAQTAANDSRWGARLDSLRARAPFRDLDATEQDRAFNRLARMARFAGRPGPRGPRPNASLPPATCLPGWKQVALLDANGFSYGSAANPQIVGANDWQPQDNIRGNASVAATFPTARQIALGAAAGTWCDLVFEPGQALFRLQGNRASAHLGKVFTVPPLSTIAPGALMATCGISLPAIGLTLIAGDPDQTVNGKLIKDADPLDTLVYVCGQATLDLVVGRPGFRGRIQRGSQNASDSEALFIRSGIGKHENNLTNTYGGHWDTSVDKVDQNDLSQPIGLLATLSAPDANATLIYVSVTVEVSAWTSPGLQSLAFVDATGQSNNLPIITAPGFIAPYTDSDADNTSYTTQPIEITSLRICGI